MSREVVVRRPGTPAQHVVLPGEKVQVVLPGKTVAAIKRMQARKRAQGEQR